MTSEVVEQWLALRRSQSQVERATAVMHWGQMAAEIRFQRFRERHPGASDEELLALWTEETYRGSVDPQYLARVCALIRAGAATGGLSDTE
jgi:hypothetical protein